MTLSADMVLMNGKVITVDAENRIAEAVAVKDGRILAVGSNEEIGGYIGEGTRVIDLEGRPLLPGFIDTHIHVAGFGKALTEINLRNVQSIEEMQTKLRRLVETKEEGE